MIRVETIGVVAIVCPKAISIDCVDEINIINPNSIRGGNVKSILTFNNCSLIPFYFMFFLSMSLLQKTVD
jgi:hypothetical protein